jgi:D-glycero-D-manno-heptose 1,7-bisphosphate phosphatase
MNTMHAAILLDRDGVIIENDPGYVLSWDDVKFYPQALKALEILKQNIYKILLVTNQSAIGQGLLPLDTAEEINLKITQQVEFYNGRIDGVFMCPHSSKEQCECRKPKPGLVLQAIRKFNIAPDQSIMIGDALTDIAAGQAAGIRTNILVLTGRGKDQLSSWDHVNPKPFQVYTDLLSVVHSLVSQPPPSPGT